MTAARTMFEKIWQRHVVVDRDDGYTLLYVDRHLMHDGSAAGFAQLRARGLRLRRPDRGFATPDHYVLSNSRSVQAIPDPASPPAGRARSGKTPRRAASPCSISATSVRASPMSWARSRASPSPA